MQYNNVDSDNDWAPNKRRAIIWPNDDLVYWHIYGVIWPQWGNYNWQKGVVETKITVFTDAYTVNKAGKSRFVESRIQDPCS